LPCQLIEKSEKLVVLEWYRLINGKTQLFQRVRYETETRTVYAFISNASESDNGFYFCTVVYMKEGTWFGKFYEAVTKPLVTQVHVVEKSKSDLVSEFLSDGIREYSNLLLADLRKNCNPPQKVTDQEILSLIFHGLTIGMLAMYLTAWCILTINDHRVINYMTELAELIPR